MQILIALCSNVLETITVVVFGGHWVFHHMWWKLKSMILCTDLWENESLLTNKSAFLQGAPSKRYFHL